MKTMRYRIRVIAMMLVTALLFLVLWCTHDIWFPSGISPAAPAVSVSPSGSPSATLSPAETTHMEWWETPSPVPSAEPVTPEPLFDTFGL